MTMSQINSVTEYEVENDIAVVTFDSPPVNALGHAVRSGMDEAVNRALADEAVIALVLICAGRTFFAGADIREFGKPMASPVLRELAGRFEAADKPIIAAIHGTALGGGLETAMACHWRIAVPAAKLGLPEVKLGLLAGAGGTQRLPRLVGAAKALDMVVSGDPIDARSALDAGLVDALAETDLRTDAIRFAREIAVRPDRLRRVRDMPTPVAAPELFISFRAKHDERLKGFEAPEASIRCIEAAATQDFEEGMRTERVLFEDLMQGAQCAAQRYIFFAEREAAKVPGLGKETKALPSDAVAIIASPAAAEDIAGHLKTAGIEIGAPEPGRLALDLGGAAASQDESARVVARFAPSAKAPKILEMLCGAKTSDAALAAGLVVAKKLGLASVVTLAGDALIGQRMADRLAETMRYCLADGLPETDLFATAEAFGITFGPTGNAATGGRPFADDAGRAIIERLLAALINEGAMLLEQGAAARASDIDIACVKAGMFKAYRGGPMFQASQLGLFRVIDLLVEHQQRWGDGHRFSPLLERLAREGEALHDYKGTRHG
ncbi:MAG: enoyl-CoA hydratase-related protein [Sphingorhabdus sp.]